MTTHFFQRVPNSDNGILHPDLVWVTAFFSEPMLRLLFRSPDSGRKQEFIYLESLHGTFITRASGLRAPPFVLA